MDSEHRDYFRTILNAFNKKNTSFVWVKETSPGRRFFYANITYEPRHEISNNVVCATSKGSDQPAHARRLIRAFARRLHIL